MGYAARKLETDDEVVTTFATVEEVRPDGLTLDDGREARRAPSCLLEPRVGDRALVVVRGAEAYVLAVLDRAGAGAARLSVEGDLDVAVQGRFTVAAQEGISLLTKERLETVAASITTRAMERSFAIDRLSIVGKELVANTRVAKLVTGALESIAERVHHHAKRSFRTIEQIDQLRAKRIDYRTDEEMALKSRHAFISATELVKILGEQIHMG